MAHPEPTKALLKQSPETAMLSTPFRCTHPPPPILPFLLKQNLSSKVIAGQGHKMKVSCRIYPATSRERANPSLYSTLINSSRYLPAAVMPYLNVFITTGVDKI